MSSLSMPSLVTRLSQSVAFVFAAGLLAGAGPLPEAQSTGDGRAAQSVVANLPGSSLTDATPDENGAPAARNALGTTSGARTPQSILPAILYYDRVLGTDFQPRVSTTTFAYDFNGCVNQTGGTDNRFVAHVNLPDGANLKFIRFYFNDTSATDMTLWLTKYQPGQSSTDITSVTSSGSAGYGTTMSPEIGGPGPSDPPAEVVDNSNYSYTLIVGPTASTSAQQFCGARIAYYFPSDGHFTSIPPCRLVDTRAPAFPAPLGGGYLPPATVRSYTIAGVCGLPAGVKAVSLNATVTGVAGSGFLTLWPQGGAFPPVSTLNYLSGETIVNAAIVPLSSTGGISMSLGVSGGHVILDVNGYYY